MSNVLCQVRLKKSEYDKEYGNVCEKYSIIKNTLLKEYNAKLLEYKKNRENYDKNYKRYKHKRYLLEYEKMENQLDLLKEMRNEILDMQKTCREYKNKCDQDSFYINSDICSIVSITRKQANKLSKQTRCGLCLEQHSIQHLMKTSCGHLYGKKCFSELLKHYFYRGEKEVKCPLCRNKEFTLYCYNVNKK